MKKRFGKRSMLNAVCAVLTCILAAGSFFGCQKDQSLETENPEYVIGVVTKSRDSEYWMSVCSGMEKAAADLGVSVIIMSPDTETDEKAQQQMIDSLLKKDIDALAVSPIDSYNADKYLKKAEKENIKVVSYDTKIMEKGVPYIGIDNEKAGRDLAEYMAGQMGKEGSVGIISGNLKQNSHASRLKGFKDYIEKNTDIRIAFTESGYSNLRMSEQEISRLMKEHPDLNGIFATSAVTALGIMEYMKDRPVLIATVDAQEDALDAVKKGRIAALAYQPGYEIGYETIRYIVNEKKGIKQPDQKIIHADLKIKPKK
ncbi:substrate-binding domain-containing protein [Anaerostipes sp.]|uniref:substrate-binding domain-containing protein n=1 Tax=Anaerostipes sp. TaxID=1872530 RepID=UPI0025B9A3F0|nr:substrate-binding domain-containing protein [Anaerostipes sp.]MBS7006903.1 substrate-binding domain-containing protein [Anaerostipes sp.]